MSKSKYLLGAMVGGMLGAVLGVLIAPRSGIETREMIKDAMDNRYSETKKKVSTEWQDKSELLKTKAEHISSRVKQLSEEFETHGHALVDRGHNLVDKGHTIVEKVAGAVKSATNKNGTQHPEE